MAGERRARKQPVSWETVRGIAGELAGAEEGSSYGTPAFKVRGKLFVRLKEDGETLVLRTDNFERDHLLKTAPQTFFITDHYKDYPWVLIRLNAISQARLQELLEDAWRRVRAPKKSPRVK